MMEIDAVKRRYADLRRKYLNRDISAKEYIESRHRIDDVFEKVMKGMENDKL